MKQYRYIRCLFGLVCTALVMIPPGVVALPQSDWGYPVRSVVAILPLEQTIPQQKSDNAPSAAPRRTDKRPITTRNQAILDYLRELGFSSQQADIIFSRAQSDLLTQLQAKQGDVQILSLMARPNYRQERLSRYLDYARVNPDCSVEEVLAWVNMGLDKPFYQQVAPVQTPDSLQVLVNKYHVLPREFTPQLVTMQAPYTAVPAQLHPVAYSAFVAMADAAQEAGIVLYNVSAYRSYEVQQALHASYVDKNGQPSADTYSAKAGYSEHQTGLALDINSAKLSDHFQETPAYAWLLEHCAQYGFLLRYPQGKQHITGYTFEPWHYRYVGEEIATICMEQGLTYEEYTAQLPVYPDGLSALALDAWNF